VKVNALYVSATLKYFFTIHVQKQHLRGFCFGPLYLTIVHFTPPTLWHVSRPKLSQSDVQGWDGKVHNSVQLCTRVDLDFMSQAVHSKKYARNLQEPYLKATSNEDCTASSRYNTNPTYCSANYGCDWTAAVLI